MQRSPTNKTMTANESVRPTFAARQISVMSREPTAKKAPKEPCNEQRATIKVEEVTHVRLCVVKGGRIAGSLVG
jgi:hypothetical protein